VKKLKSLIKNGVKRLIDASVTIMGKTSLGRYLYRQVIAGAMNRSQTVRHQNVSLIFSVPNELNQFRVDTFSTKEPETLEWIDGIPEGSVLWDVGANIGLYSCYAAKRRGCRVFAFEPSVFNLELLARNIFLNDLTDGVTIVPLPLSNALGVSKLNMTTTDWGGALSTFGQSYGHDGQKLERVFQFATLGLSIADAVKLLGIPVPDYIKMDVDGIEHLILSGGQSVLQHVRGVLIEVNDDFDAQARGCATSLTEAGLTLSAKRHSEMVEESSAFRGAFNQIWSRNDDRGVNPSIA
jgi:FkbM family methyltransferase